MKRSRQNGRGSRKAVGERILNVDVDNSVRDDDELVPPRPTARLLGISENTLANWRVAGTGPPYVKLGNSRTSAIRYRRSDIKAFIAQMARTSTVDPGPEGC